MLSEPARHTQLSLASLPWRSIHPNKGASLGAGGDGGAEGWESVSVEEQATSHPRKRWEIYLSSTPSLGEEQCFQLKEGSPVLNTKKPGKQAAAWLSPDMKGCVCVSG